MLHWSVSGIKQKRKWKESVDQCYVIMFVSSLNCEQLAIIHVIIQLLFPITPWGGGKLIRYSLNTH